MSSSMSASFEALLLAGGHSRRMGVDKAFLIWQGCPLWQHQTGLLLSLQPRSLIISARWEQVPDFGVMVETSPHRWHFDPASEYSPMEAIDKALIGCGRSALLVLAVDLPHMRAEILRSLVEHWQNTGRGLVYDIEGQGQPLTALYPGTISGLVHEFVRRRNLRLQALVREGVAQGFLDLQPLPAEWVPAFFNTNTPEEWDQARQPPT